MNIVFFVLYFSYEHNVNHFVYLFFFYLYLFFLYFYCINYCFCFLINFQGEFNDAIGAVECQLCSENSFATDKNRQIPCDQCPTGRTSKEGSTKCSDCAPGKFKNVVNDEEICTDCPIGFAQSDTDQESCTQCIKGEEAPTGGSSFCAACDLGTFNLIAGQDCLACPAGQYQDGKGETSCKNCEVDTYLNEPGKSSKADCTSCEQDRSTGFNKGSQTKASCLCKRSDYYQDDTENCQPCPKGADCSNHDGILLAHVTALPGFWRHEDIFVNCDEGYKDLLKPHLAKQRCCPLVDGNVSKCTSNSTDQCEEGYTGTLCMTCTTGYVRTGFECIPCEGGPDEAGAIHAIAGLCSVLFVVFSILFMKAKDEEKEDDKAGGKKKKKNQKEKGNAGWRR